MSDQGWCEDYARWRVAYDEESGMWRHVVLVNVGEQTFGGQHDTKEEAVAAMKDTLHRLGITEEGERRQS